MIIKISKSLLLINIKKSFYFIVFFAIPLKEFAQQPRWTPKHFVSNYDTSEFRPIIPKNDGSLKTYILSNVQIMDIDADSTTYTMSNTTALVCYEGMKVHGKRNGVFSVYVIDSSDHSKRYKIWEQTYQNDKLNGEWKVFTLHGTL